MDLICWRSQEQANSRPGLKAFSFIGQWTAYEGRVSTWPRFTEVTVNVLEEMGRHVPVFMWLTFPIGQCRQHDLRKVPTVFFNRGEAGPMTQIFVHTFRHSFDSRQVDCPPKMYLSKYFSKYCLTTPRNRSQKQSTPQYSPNHYPIFFVPITFGWYTFCFTISLSTFFVCTRGLK